MIAKETTNPQSPWVTYKATIKVKTQPQQFWVKIKELNRTDYAKQIQRDEIPEWDEDGVDEKIQRLKLQIAEKPDPKVKREIPDSHTDRKREIWRGEVVCVGGGGVSGGGDLKGEGDGDEESGKSGETMDRGLGGGGSNQRFVVEGKVVVAKNPCLHPGDVRVLRAVDVPALVLGSRRETHAAGGEATEGSQTQAWVTAWR
ncbi:hypothetical protein FH972_006518 [Carpinus fangiana]|uniref:RNA-dependent RNA polymerase n=1 Tax=Carpinus fangiana TaxID=176857 RepID=A0A5N6QSJ5_9ROSI|nr:hypothetical protein FH972_006518 [Carpinus fangiana]